MLSLITVKGKKVWLQSIAVAAFPPGEVLERVLAHVTEVFLNTPPAHGLAKWPLCKRRAACPTHNGKHF